MRFAGKIIRRGKLFVGESYSLGKVIRRGKLFVGESYSSGKVIRRGKLFVGESYSSGKVIRRGKLFVGESYSSGKVIRRGKFSSPSQNFVIYIILYNINSIEALRYGRMRFICALLFGTIFRISTWHSIHIYNSVFPITTYFINLDFCCQFCSFFYLLRLLMPMSMSKPLRVQGYNARHAHAHAHMGTRTHKNTQTYAHVHTHAETHARAHTRRAHMCQAEMTQHINDLKEIYILSGKC